MSHEGSSHYLGSVWLLGAPTFVNRKQHFTFNKAALEAAIDCKRKQTQDEHARSSTVCELDYYLSFCHLSIGDTITDVYRRPVNV